MVRPKADGGDEERINLKQDYLNNAKPIFLAGLDERLNVQAGFRKNLCLTAVPSAAVVQIAARSFYRLYVNGRVVMNGPARTARGYLRVDELDVLPFLHAGVNCFAMEITSSCGCLRGYSNDICADGSMLLAEILIDGKCAAATDESWDALRLTQRDEYSDMISHCRQNTEVYHLDAAYAAWRTAVPGAAGFPWRKAAVCGEKPRFLPRRMLLPEMKKVKSARLVECGRAHIDRSLPVRDAWYEADLAEYYQRLSDRPIHDYLRTVDEPADGVVDYLPDGVRCSEREESGTAYAHFDFGALQLGFIGFTFSCDRDGMLDVVHLESYGEKGEKEQCVGGANPITRLYVKKGAYSFLTMEPALFCYLKFYFRGVGNCTLTDVHVRTYHYPDRGMGSFQCSDDDVNRLYEAARRTLLLNTLDIFMDCPERERGGWLCDSLWTARAAALMLGDLSVEKAFLENFLLAPEEEPHGFFPEVYPATKAKGGPSITTWSFWLMIELYEYAQRSGDVDFLREHRARVERFVEGSGDYIGPSGLLENMPCIFVDWSQSNDAENTQPISTAANALYALALNRLGALYGREDWLAGARKVRNILRDFLLSHQDPAKPWICDAIRVGPDGCLRPGGRYSEACQYTVLWTGLFEKEEIPRIYRAAVRTMGPCPEFAPNPTVGRSGLFIGLCVRFDMLARFGEYETLFRELKAVYGPQLREGPGTLWENQVLETSSRCHGFNSHVGVHFTRDFLGLDIPAVYDVERKRRLTAEETKKRMQRPAHLCGLRWMRGCVRTPSGAATRYVER